MVLRLELATASDATRSIDIEKKAYGTSEIGPCIYPGPFPPTTSDKIPRVKNLLKMLNDPHCRWIKVIDTDLSEDEQMISFSCWYFFTDPYQPMEPQDYGPGSNPEACEAFFGEFRMKRNARFGGKCFVHLRLLHTHPDHQGRGAASMMLKWGAAEADRLGLVSYLEASPVGKKLYEKNGFQELETVRVDFSKWGGPAEFSTALMSRPASM